MSTSIPDWFDFFFSSRRRHTRLQGDWSSDVCSSDLGGENFVIEIGVPQKDQHPSTAKIFTIVKNEPYLRVYEQLAAGFSPRSILELGIFQGGSYVLLDKLFKPRRMSAVEISPQPVEPLLRYIAAMEGRFVHFSTSQCDREILGQIV